MISLEQVQLLESRVAKAIEYAQKTTSENAALVAERAALQAKLDANQKRIDELEVLVMRFKEDQSRIEDGIIAALDRLSQFEEAFENSLKDKEAEKKTAVKSKEQSTGASAAVGAPAAVEQANPEVFFEIPKSELPKTEPEKKPKPSNDDSSSEGELDIF